MPIEGELTIDEVEQLIKSYYQSKETHTSEYEEKLEADRASINIRKLLTEQPFAFSLVGLTAIHRRIFTGIYKFAGKIRDYNITKREWVLQGDYSENAVNYNHVLQKTHLVSKRIGFDIQI